MVSGKCWIVSVLNMIMAAIASTILNMVGMAIKTQRTQVATTMTTTLSTAIKNIVKHQTNQPTRKATTETKIPTFNIKHTVHVFIHKLHASASQQT